MSSPHTPAPGRGTAVAEHTPECRPASKWAALVEDRVIPLPRRVLTARTIKEQAGVSEEFLLVRDYQSPVDVVLQDDSEVDLQVGNVFRIVRRCDAPAQPPFCDGPAKLAFFVDDRFEVTVLAEQTADSLRRLFGLSPKGQLLRDLESPNDTIVPENARVRFADGPVFITRAGELPQCGGEEPPGATCLIHYTVDGEPQETTHRKKTASKIMKDAGVDPQTHYLIQLKGGHEQESYKEDPNREVPLCEGARFITASLEPTPVS